MEKNKLKEVLQDQQALFDQLKDLVEREVSLSDYMKGNEIVIITGIRRCGKSSLLKIISKKLNEKFVYMNFDDIRLTDFKVENFEDIEEIVSEIYGIKTKVIYFLDEVQNVPSWERWVNNLYAKKIKVFVTGSNSNLLSSEISTFLTGRNKVIKLYPFSFKEFLLVKKIKVKYQTTDERRAVSQGFHEYFEKGGFPLVIINDDLSLSKQYFEDILNKDIIKRYGIKKIKELNDLILYLFSNVSKTYSYSALKQVSSIRSLSMINNYIEYLKNVFVASTINKFDYSIKKQKVSSSKFYVLDNSFLKTVAFNFSENAGKRLENLVFIELVRCGNEVYYHAKKNECDFIIKEGLKITKAIQVCLILDNAATKKREVDGLIEALKEYQLKEGLILTMDKEEEFVLEGKRIIIKPVWKWLLEKD
ncbi:MAG: ATP-binding protein [Candidatus Woesearchaeota archaeon]|nr:ATP-binding protein [Candidatus Woesearchaeota archaeon]